jgi:hypothetical protein
MLFKVYFGFRPIAVTRPNHQKPNGLSKADLQFRRKQSPTVSAKNLTAVGQTAMSFFLDVRLLCSATGHIEVQCDRQITVIGTNSLGVKRPVNS